MKIKTTELKGLQLNYAVAKAVIEHGRIELQGDEVLWWDEFNRFEVLGYEQPWAGMCGHMVVVRPVDCWFQCGALVDQFEVWLTGSNNDGSEWIAGIGGRCSFAEGVTARESICRSVVLLKIGEEVEIPGELVAA